MRERSRRPGVQAILKNATIKSKLFRSELKAIRCPILLVWGQKEDLFSKSHLEFFKSGFHPHLLHVFQPKNIGHVGHVLGPAFLSGVISFFMSENVR